jgi:hypothetical protein
MHSCAAEPAAALQPDLTLLHCCWPLQPMTTGVADDKAGEADAVAEEAEAGEGEGEEGAALPAWPKFEGLTYQSGLQLPCSTADIPFPPASAVVAAI